jgi:hypothetical protein
MIPHPPRQRMEISSLRSTTIITITTANIAATLPASWWCRVAATTTITTIIITTANIADVKRRQTVEKQGLRALFPCVN